jgi:hypothetical protein
VNVAPTSGQLAAVQVPGSPVFEPLIEDSQVPVGSEIDTSAEAVAMDSDGAAGGDLDLRHVEWYGGLFTVSQNLQDGAPTEVSLTGSLDCTAGATPRPTDPGQGPIRGRGVWGHGGRGHKSSGHKSSATVRGTWWLVQDLCDGKTRTYVKEGVVQVRDFDRARDVSIEPGESYEAPGPPDVTLTSAPPSLTADPAPSFEFTAGEDGWSFECSMDTQPFKPCASPEQVGPLADGRHTFSVRATDGVSDEIPTAQRSFTVKTATAGGVPHIPAEERVSPRRCRVTGGFTALDDGRLSAWAAGGHGGAWRLSAPPTDVRNGDRVHLTLRPRDEENGKALRRALRRDGALTVRVHLRFEDTLGNTKTLPPEHVRLVRLGR